jgi:hypothetical protein
LPPPAATIALRAELQARAEAKAADEQKTLDHDRHRERMYELQHNRPLRYR